MKFAALVQIDETGTCENVLTYDLLWALLYLQELNNEDKKKLKGS